MSWNWKPKIARAVAKRKPPDSAGEQLALLFDRTVDAPITPRPCVRSGHAGPEQGRSGGYRMMIAFRAGDFSVFLFGFAKSDESNVDDRQLAILRRIAGSWLSADATSIKKAVERGELTEVRP